MRDILKTAVKTGLAFFAVGALLALAAGTPTVAGFFHVTPEQIGLQASPLWTGAYFAGFGVLSALLMPAVSYMMGDKSAPETGLAKCSPEAPAPQIVIAVGQAQGLDASRARWGEGIRQERIAPSRLSPDI
ncbi:MAG: hypothetical protein JO089_00935 [Alphaproteobacteria bacterium]|nr:hypothetical protein [Alphaproteobacteria bacterium]